MKRFARFIESKGGPGKITSIEIEEWINSQRERMNPRKSSDKNDEESNDADPPNDIEK